MRTEVKWLDDFPREMERSHGQHVDIVVSLTRTGLCFLRLQKPDRRRDTNPLSTTWKLTRWFSFSPHDDYDDDSSSKATTTATILYSHSFYFSKNPIEIHVGSTTKNKTHTTRWTRFSGVNERDTPTVLTVLHDTRKLETRCRRFKIYTHLSFVSRLLLLFLHIQTPTQVRWTLINVSLKFHTLQSTSILACLILMMQEAGFFYKIFPVESQIRNENAPTQSRERRRRRFVLFSSIRSEYNR